MEKMIFNKDNLILGLVLGFVGPLLGLLFLYYFLYPSFTLLEFLDSFFHENRLLTSIGSLSLLVNAILFTFYVNTQRDQTAKGIFIITVFYGIGILLLKMFN
ncbi:MAG: hypothetical protein FJY19_05530 [Bacteroidetes bacterium]|nr:hypothetical protein [Bacteroidota bacterium]